MKRFLDVRETSFDLSDDLDKVIDVEPPASGTCDDSHAARAQAERLYDFPGDAHFFLRFGRQRDANRVANAFVQQDSETDRGFNCAGESGAGLCHAQVKWIVNLLGEQTVSSNRALNVRGLQGNNDVGKVEIFENLNVAHGRFDHRFGRGGPVLLQQILLQRTTVDADANRNFLRLRRAHDFDDPFVLADVAGIQTQLIDAGLERQQRQLVMKVNVCDQRNFRHSFSNFLERDCSVVVRDGESHDLATRGDHLFNLLYCLIDVGGVSFRH